MLKEFGEEPQAHLIARWIVDRRVKKPFENTTDLSAFLESKLHRSQRGIQCAHLLDDSTSVVDR